MGANKENKINVKNIIKESYSEDYLSGDFDAIPLFNSFQSVKDLMEGNDEE